MDLEAIRRYRLKPVEHSYADRDTILYALSLGFGDAPGDSFDLQFVYEKGLKALPSQSVVLAHPGFWITAQSLKVDWLKVLHGEQSFKMLRPLTPSGKVRGEYEITAVEDKGAEKGAVMYVTKRLLDSSTNELIAIVTSAYVLRGDGGCGSFGTRPLPPPPLPDKTPDIVIDIPVLPQAALIYRLSGDMNPIHVDPMIAAEAGFPRPILHGLCTMGFATRALVQSIAGGDPAKLREMFVRFSKPAFPSETLRTEIFQESGIFRFRVRAVERNTIVLDRGTAVIS